MHHPCFFDCFCSGHAGDGFQLHGGLFSPCQFGDTVFALHSDFFVARQSGMGRCSKLVLWSKSDRYRIAARTIGSESGSIAGWRCLHSCKQPECSRKWLVSPESIWGRSAHPGMGSLFGIHVAENVLRWTRSCNQSEDALKRKCLRGAYRWLQELFLKARRWLFGLFRY